MPGLCLSRVSELCSCIERVSGERSEDQVLLTADGRQMDPKDLIGSYSVGTVSIPCVFVVACSPIQCIHNSHQEEKPLFVFYRSYISNSDPPGASSRLPQSMLSD